ncbi:hypothetical protein [Caldilinea sp.]|uniref:hypothetical protein n=1 Tax=Caldilinea sp. TaxID=2293560 RepID=UPI002CD46B0A|nr:hypothetical protein [Anaerolineales bacterium]HQY91178.1 hypothetical protein [Caldilinea sp.]HRA68304.1 hypothetical protein [Caldilinea sp.]
MSSAAANNDPIRFLRYLVAALQQYDAESGRDVQMALAAAQSAPPRSLASALLNDLAGRAQQRFLLVRDDFHLLKVDLRQVGCG